MLGCLKYKLFQESFRQIHGRVHHGCEGNYPSQWCSSGLPKAPGCQKWKGTPKSLYSLPFFRVCQAVSVGSAGDRGSHWGTLGWPLLLLHWTHSKGGGTKVCWRSVWNTPLLSHTSSSCFTPTKKRLRSIYLINVFQQSTCLLGHHLSEVVPGFVVFIILFPRTSHKVSGNSCWLRCWTRASVSTKRSGYTA